MILLVAHVFDLRAILLLASPVTDIIFFDLVCRETDLLPLLGVRWPLALFVWLSDSTCPFCPAAWVSDTVPLIFTSTVKIK